MRTDRRFERVKRLLAHCYDKPEVFNRVFLRRPPFWWRQTEIGRSVARHRNTVVVSANGTGKDFCTGTLVPWWLWTRHHSLVYITGPSQTVLGSVTWKEVRRALANPRFPMPCRISEGVKASPQVVEINTTGWGALGFSTTSIERASGHHDRNLFVVVQEASSAGDDIKEAIRGLNPARLALFGNPIRAAGWFRDMAERGVAERGDPAIPDEARTNTIVIPAFDSPDIELPRSPRGLADRGFLEEARRDYGEHSLWWRSHVLARFPDLDADALIPPAWLDRAADAQASPRPTLADGGPARMAVDLGRGVGADRSAIVVRDALGLLEVWESNAAGLPEVAARARALLHKWRVPQDRLSYDALGIGQEFASHLAGVGLSNAVPYYGSGSGGKHHANLRTFAAFALKARLNPDHTLEPVPDRLTGRIPEGTARLRQPPFHIVPGPWWPSLREEILALRYELVGDKVKLENKDDLCRRLGRSPDLGDALIQSFAWPD